MRAEPGAPLALAAFACACAAAAWGGPAGAWAAQTPPEWFLGEGMAPRSVFRYDVCDREDARIGCYTADVTFMRAAPGPRGAVWLAHAEVSAGGRPMDLLFHVSPSTFEAHPAYAAGREYVDSLGRTLFWASKVASQRDPQALEVGRSWGEARAAPAAGDEVLVLQSFEGDGGRTYEVGYPGMRMLLRDGFPLPVEARAHRPQPSGAEAFSLRLLGHWAEGEGPPAAPAQPGGPPRGEAPAAAPPPAAAPGPARPGGAANATAPAPPPAPGVAGLEPAAAELLSRIYAAVARAVEAGNASLAP